jgi:hypothetical protein
MIAIYQVGYDVAAFRVNILKNMTSLSLNLIFAATIVPFIGLAMHSFIKTHRD